MAQQQFPILGASACVWRGPELLLVRRQEGIWAFPGGKVKAGETVMAAAARELAEETGVTADLQQLVGVYDVIRRGAEKQLTHHFAIACYWGDWISGEARAVAEIAEAQWFAPDASLKLSLAPNMRDAISAAVRLRSL